MSHLPPYVQFSVQRSFDIARFKNMVLSIEIWSTSTSNYSFDTNFEEAIYDQLLFAPVLPGALVTNEHQKRMYSTYLHKYCRL